MEIQSGPAHPSGKPAHPSMPGLITKVLFGVGTRDISAQVWYGRATDPSGFTSVTAAALDGSAARTNKQTRMNLRMELTFRRRPPDLTVAGAFFEPMCAPYPISGA